MAPSRAFGAISPVRVPVLTRRGLVCGVYCAGLPRDDPQRADRAESRGARHFRRQLELPFLWHSPAALSGAAQRRDGH